MLQALTMKSLFIFFSSSGSDCELLLLQLPTFLNYSENMLIDTISFNFKSELFYISVHDFFYSTCINKIITILTKLISAFNLYGVIAQME